MRDTLKQLVVRYMKWFMWAYCLALPNLVIQFVNTSVNNPEGVPVQIVVTFLGIGFFIIVEGLCYQRYKKFRNEDVLWINLFKFLTVMNIFGFIVTINMIFSIGVFNWGFILLVPETIIGILLWRSANKYKKIQLGLIQDTDLENKETGL